MKYRNMMLLSMVFAIFPFAGFLCGDEEVTVAPPDRPDASAKNDAAEAARIFFASPEDGATIARQSEFVVGTEGFMLVSEDHQVAPDQGHLHILIDIDCKEPGYVFDPESEEAIDMEDGQYNTTLALDVGEHTLCVQAGDSDHKALDLVDRITVFVEE